MSDAELRRLRDDLDTMQQAAGMGLPFEWPDVWETLVLVPAGGFLAGWAFLAPADWSLLGLVPLLLLALAAGARRAWRRLRSGTPPPARRERSLTMVSSLVIVGGLALYFVWVRTFGLVHGPPGIVAIFFLGLICLCWGLTARQRRVCLAGAVSLIPYALVAPLCGSRQQSLAVGGFAVVLAGLMAAAIMAWQLRDSRGSHESATR
jgi:hypothetical protein